MIWDDCLGRRHSGRQDTTRMFSSVFLDVLAYYLVWTPVARWRQVAEVGFLGKNNRTNHVSLTIKTPNLWRLQLDKERRPRRVWILRDTSEPMFSSSLLEHLLIQNIFR